LHLGHPQSIIDTIEGCPQTNAVSQNLFPLETNNINFHNARFEDYFQSLNEEKYDLIFIDGNHRGLALLSYIEQLTPYAHNGTLWILDDIRWSDDMWDAWEKIVENPQFHLSIDFGRMALVSYRKQQEKEHFMLRL
jgi:hypothetical protein